MAVVRTYRNTPNVRRLLRAECGADCKFDLPFMAWIKDGAAKTLGDVADEWLRRRNSNYARSLDSRRTALQLI